MTTARRGSPIPQLSVVGGSARNSGLLPSVVQCKNVGSDGFDVQWECKADLDESVKFGRISVSCEGYNSPSDPYVLKGSCGLEYELEYTRKGRNENSYHSDYYESNQEYESTSSGLGSFITFVVIVVIVFCTLSVCSKRQHQYVPSPEGGGGFWTGFTLGGLVSWLFSRPSYGYGNYGYGGYGSRRTSSWPSSSRSRSSGGGSRTASGFGGTTRR